MILFGELLQDVVVYRTATQMELDMTRQNWIWISLLFAAMFALPATANAQAGQALFDYQMKNRAQTDTGAPVLILRAREFIKSGTATFERSDGKTSKQKIGRMKPGQEKRLPFRQPKGKFKYKITLEGVTSFDQTITMNLETEVVYVDPIKLTVNPKQVQVGEGRMVLRSNVPLDKVDIEVFDNNGGKVVEKTQAIGGKGGDVELTWPAKVKEVGAIRLKAHDIAGFWAGVVLEPFWVEIPHEDIEFDNGKDTWQPSETPKLTSTLGKIKEAMAKHKKKGLELSMYVAGYTDTVGGHSDNIKLSQARARAIGKWFRKNGIKVDVYYQGFGESVLAVNTPDNTPEPKNRRAVYILGNTPPPTSSQIPRANWKRL